MVKVSLYIYDISKGMARQLSLPLLGKQVDGIWHTGIVCYGKEYFFGSDGIDHCPPCGTILGQPDETVCMGETSITKKILHEYLAGLSKQTFSADKYDLFLHNCNTFSNEVSQFLTGKKIPSYITDLPQEVMSTPFGAMIGQYFQNVRQQPNITSGGGASAGFNGGGGGGGVGVLDLDDDETAFEGYPDTHPIEPPRSDHSDSVTSYDGSQDLSLLPATYPVDLKELEEGVKFLKKNFKHCAKALDKIRGIIDEIDFDFGNEDETRQEITESLSCLCKELQSANVDAHAFKCVLVMLKATALSISKIFKYAEGDDIVVMVTNKLQRGLVNDVKLLRVQFLTNLLSVYELRNHILAIDSMLRTLVNLAVSSVLDGPGPAIREAGCCLAYSLSIVKINDDHAFELSSALLHAVCELSYNTKAREYCVGALKSFINKSDQVSELAQMIVPDIYESELRAGRVQQSTVC